MPQLCKTASATFVFEFSPVQLWHACICFYFHKMLLFVRVQLHKVITESLIWVSHLV